MVNFDSDEERFYSWYLEELVEAGWVNSYECQPEPFVLTEPVYNTYILETKLKTKIKTEIKKQTILSGAIYTSDFKINWNEKANNIFYQVLEESNGRQIRAPFIAHRDLGEEAYSYIETKGTYDSNGSIRRFRDGVMKFLYSTQRIYVNLVIVPTIFKDTFVPHKYLKTPTGKDKKINFLIKTLEDFTNGKSSNTISL